MHDNPPLPLQLFTLRKVPCDLDGLLASNPASLEEPEHDAAIVPGAGNSSKSRMAAQKLDWHRPSQKAGRECRCPTRCCRSDSSNTEGCQHRLAQGLVR